MTPMEFQEYMGKSEAAQLAVFKMLMKSAPMGVWYMSQTGEVLYVSESWKRITGISEAEVLGTGYTQLVHPDDLPLISALMEAKLQDASVDYAVEFRLRQPDGSYKWFASRAETSLAHNGYPPGLVGITLDIDRVHTVDAEAKMLRRAVDAASNPVVVTDHNPLGRERNPIRFVNPAFERLTGYALADIKGRDPRFLHGSDTLQPALAQIREAVAEHREISGVYVRNYKKSGEMYVAEVSVSPIYVGNVLTHWVGVQTVATEQVRIREMEELRTAIGKLLHATGTLNK